MQEIIFGIHSINAFVKTSPERLIEVYILKDREDKRLQDLISELVLLGITTHFANKQTLDKKANGGVHQGILAKIKATKELNEHDLEIMLSQQKNALLLVLDSITDPHNLGACLRNADAAGVDAVIIPKDKTTKLTPIARKVACGAAETVPLISVTNLARTLRMIKENYHVMVIGTTGKSKQTIYQLPLITGPVALVMGAEDRGMRRLTEECCDQLVSIPMRGSVSSLNVSVATGICLFDITRQMMNQTSSQ